MKLKRIAALCLSLLMIAGVAAIFGPLTATAIPAENRAIGFARMFSAGPAPNNNWNQAFLPEDRFVNFDITQEGLHTITFPPAWRNDPYWLHGNTQVFVLLPNNPSGEALPVTVESIAVNGEPRITHGRFNNGGSFWNNTAGTFFGDITLAQGNFSGVPGFALRNFSITDITGRVTGEHGLNAGPSESMGEIRIGDVLSVTFRVGERPPTDYGQVRDAGYISAADLTLLTRYLDAPDRSAFRVENPNFNLLNADVNGDGRIDEADVALLAQYLAATETVVLLGPPPPPPPLVAITFDDGPSTQEITLQVLNYALQRNSRPEVLSGEIPRMALTFYIDGDGVHNWPAPVYSALVARAAREGHAVDNHTWSHATTWHNAGRQGIINNMRQVEDRFVIPEAGPIQGINPVTNFSSWSFRPPFFNYSAPMVGLDRELNLPFIFAGIDPDDWRGNHTGEAMYRFIMDGSSSALCSCDFNCAMATARMPDGTLYVGARGNDGRGADGGNILFHDGGGNPRARTMDALMRIVPALEELGYEMVTVEEMYRRKGLQPCWFQGNRRTPASVDQWHLGFNEWAAPCPHDPPCYQVQPLLNRDGTFFLEHLNEEVQQ
jgi:peptidoglycan/xylan/chitin deacetylase (PgdA/CDA1 family)